MHEATLRSFAVIFPLLLSLAGSLSARESDSSRSYTATMRAAFNLYEKTRQVKYWETAFEIAESKKNAFLRENVKKLGNMPAPAIRSRRPSASITTLQAMLRDEKTAVLSYSSGADQLYIFLVTGETFYAARLPVGSVFFHRLNATRNSLQTRKDFNRTTAHQLYQKLIEPVAPYLQGKTHLVIIPDEGTNLVPFEALVPDTASGRFLLHAYAVSYSYSVSAVINSLPPPTISDRQKVLALAPFNVPASEKEIMNIKADHVMGTRASREQFLKIAPDYPIIHLATYATITDPRQSFIGFNAGNKDKNADSRLFASDIYRMNLKKVNLLILNPCQTPEKRPASLAGLVTMAYALAHAGCPNFITSLWETEMQPSGKISMKLHQYIHKGYGYARALQQARIDYLANPTVDERLKSPGHWAGFILIGEIDTVPQSHKFFYYFALAFTVFAVVYILRRKNHRCRHAEYPEYL